MNTQDAAAGDLARQPIGQYLDDLAVRVPAPGGGATAALHAAQAAALRRGCRPEATAASSAGFGVDCIETKVDLRAAVREAIVTGEFVPKRTPSHSTGSATRCRGRPSA
ncbi:cyclodeaminase/cyclohydrolase family protein [Streptomyces sp. KM273126]|uniref:cyclodeaminase/cyclohydrolase family protein n=1 Tax=Streptomyces sp. KM273126 TaxID=2545247 RepID=UPI0026B99BDA|nr:cyclodeaminase/cyclohydrolase family protein [Streptomyces sp. KM273126]